MKILYKSTNSNQNTAKFVCHSGVGPKPKESNDDFLVENYKMLTPKENDGARDKNVSPEELKKALIITNGDLLSAIKLSSQIKRIDNKIPRN